MIFSQDAEMAALGSAILDPKAAVVVCRILRSEMFWLPSHRVIFDTITAIRQGGAEVDLVTIKCAIESGPGLNSVGGIEYLAQVAEAPATSKMAAHYADIVLRDWRLREVIARAKSVADHAEKGEWPDSVALGLKLLHGLTDDGTYEFDAGEIVGDLDEDDLPGVPSVFESVNASLRLGGYPRGEVTVIGAETGQGKTLVMCQDIAASCRAGRNIACVTLEMPAQAIMRRIAKQCTGVWSLRDAERHGLHAINDYRAWVDDVRLGWSLSFFDTSLLADAETRVSNVCDWIVRRHEVYPLDLVYVDYAQLLSGGRGEEWQRQAAVSRALRAVAKRLGIAVVALVQIEMDAQSRRHQIRGSREYGKDAALTLFVVKERQDNIESTWLVCPKNRHGLNAWRTELVLDQATVSLKEVRGSTDGVYRGASD